MLRAVAARRHEDDPFEAVLAQLGRDTDLLWLAGNAIGLGLTLVAAYLVPLHGLALAYLAVLLRIALYVVAGSRLGLLYFDRMLRLGLVAGVFEIFADYVLVEVLPTGGLVYLTRDAVLLESPLYMPLAWACVIVELGYVPVRVYGLLRGRGRARAAPAAIASVLGGTLAGLAIGLYEYFAFRAGWWKYEPAAAMIGPACAAYIPLGECLMFLGILPIFTAMVRGRDPARSGPVLWGIAFAGLILVSYVVAWVLLEGLAAGVP